MAISYQVNNHNLLNLWQEVMLEDIWHFNQAAGAGAPRGECHVYIQSERELIARALDVAWAKMTTRLSFFPRPTWHTETISLARNPAWRFQQLQTRYGYLIAFGSRATELITAAAPVVYSDADGDGVDDTATITVNTSHAADEVQAFFQVADGAYAAADERFQIEPLRATQSGNTVTLTGHRALFVKPNTIWQVPFVPSDPNKRDRNEADTAQTAGFVTAVDVYRVYNDPANAVTVNEDPYHSWCFACGEDCTTQTADGCARVVDARLGIMQVRNDCLNCRPRWPESVTVNYLSGVPLVYGQVDPDLANALIRLANTHIQRKFCAFCDATEQAWAQDVLPPGGQNDGVVNSVSPREVNNPFGTLRGQIEAWRTVEHRALAQGGAL